jgi:hypothetical protein
LGARTGCFGQGALLSRKLENDETEISELVGKVVPLAKEVVWAVDQPAGSAALLLALLWERGQGVLSTSPASPSTESATPTAASPRPMPAMPASSPTWLV